MPAATTCSSIDARAPLPTAIIVTTAPTPIVMPTQRERRPQRISPQRFRRELEGLTARHYATSETGGGSCSQLLAGQPRHGVRRVRHDAAVAEADDARAVLRDLVLVRDDDDRDAALALELLKDLHHLDTGARVEVARRLVREQDRRLGHQRARDRHALLLAARQLIRMMVRAVGEPDRGERRHRLLPSLARRALVAVVEQRQLDVLDGRRSRQQIEALKHEPDRRVPHAGQLVLDSVETSRPFST